LKLLPVVKTATQNLSAISANETLARVLFNLGYVNTLGSGVPRMIRLQQEQAGRAPDFAVGDAQFLVRLWSRYWQTFQQPNQ